jgi:hypothetical protein
METDAAEKEVVRLSYSNLEVKKRWSLASSFSNIPLPAPIKKLKRERTVRFQTEDYDLRDEKKVPYKYEPDSCDHILPPPVVQTPPREKGFAAWCRREIRGLPMPIIVAIAVGIVLLLTLIGTLAGIYGSAAAHKKSSNATTSSTTPVNSNNTGAIIIPKPVGSLTISRPGLASLNFTDDTGVINHRLYWQDNSTGMIVGKDWNATSKFWGPGAAADSGAKITTQAKPNTAIAAAASSNPFVSR